MVRTTSRQSLDICDIMPRYRDGKKITVEEGRVEIVVEGKKRKLIFKDTHLEDAGEITCKTNTKHVFAHFCQNSLSRRLSYFF